MSRNQRDANRTEKLLLRKETLRRLTVDRAALQQANGGLATGTTTFSRGRTTTSDPQY